MGHFTQLRIFCGVLLFGEKSAILVYHVLCLRRNLLPLDAIFPRSDPCKSKYFKGRVEEAFLFESSCMLTVEGE